MADTLTKRRVRGGLSLPGKLADREDRIVAMWARGLSYAAIGRELGMRDRSVAGLISRLRADGWELLPRR